MDSTESIIDYLISIFSDDIRAIIPQMAMSGGTMIACSCKEIIMGKQSSLGPVDPQMGEVSAQNVVKEFKLAKKEIKEEPESIPYWEILLNKYPINFLFECENLIEWSEEILEKSLKNSMFKENHQKTINQIIANLNSNEISKDHSRNLSAKKCEEIGLKIKYLEDDEELQDLVLSVHHACMSYINHEKACKIFLNQKNCFVINNEKK